MRTQRLNDATCIIRSDLSITQFALPATIEYTISGAVSGVTAESGVVNLSSTPSFASDLFANTSHDFAPGGAASLQRRQGLA